MEKNYEINFFDEGRGTSYGITLTVINKGRVHSVEVTRNPHCGCASYIRNINQKNIKISKLEKIK